MPQKIVKPISGTACRHHGLEVWATMRAATMAVAPPERARTSYRYVAQTQRVRRVAYHGAVGPAWLGTPHLKGDGSLRLIVSYLYICCAATCQLRRPPSTVVRSTPRRQPAHELS